MEEALEAAWRVGFSEAMDGLVLDEDGDGPLWRLTLYAPSGAGASARSSALVFAANHAVSDQLSFNRVLSEVLSVLAERRAGRPVAPPTPLPLPPSVEGALLGKEQRQAEEIKSRLELLLGRFGDAWGPELGGRRWLPSWEPGRARLSTIKYAAWQMAASGMRAADMGPSVRAGRCGRGALGAPSTLDAQRLPNARASDHRGARAGVPRARRHSLGSALHRICTWGQ